MSRVEYVPAWWLPGPHIQTLWGKLVRKIPPAPVEREKWEAPDGDLLDIYRLKTGDSRARIVILHGLEGTVRSHYAQGLLWQAYRRGWSADLMVFRSCGATPSTAPRLYHSGETGDLTWVLDRVISESPSTAIGLIGVSLGGNVILKYLGENGLRTPAQIRAATAISVPFDLERSSRFIDRGFSRVYQAHFLRTLRKKARVKLAQHPHLAEINRVQSARTMFEYDDAMTAPAHGFADASDYYAQSSSLNWIDRIQTPTLLLSSSDDPFLPSQVLDEVTHKAAQNPHLTLEFHKRGGHAGFIAGRNPFHPIYYAEVRAADFVSGFIT